jgi:hypothetical protein
MMLSAQPCGMGTDEAQEHPEILANMLVQDVLAARAGAAALLAAHGLPCERCVVAESSSIGECLRAYGLNDAAIVRALDGLP